MLIFLFGVMKLHSEQQGCLAYNDSENPTCLSFSYLLRTPAFGSRNALLTTWAHLLMEPVDELAQIVEELG